MTAMAVFSTDAPTYGATATGEDGIIAQALAILRARVKRGGVELVNPKDVREFLMLHAAKSTHAEVFTVLFLDSQHRAIECRDMFHGSLTQCSIYPGEIARAALDLRASAVILSHNHPSGDTKPSRADQSLTHMLKSALALVDVQVLDHIITASGSSLSMAETGMM